MLSARDGRSDLEAQGFSRELVPQHAASSRGTVLGTGQISSWSTGMIEESSKPPKEEIVLGTGQNGSILTCPLNLTPTSPLGFGDRSRFWCQARGTVLGTGQKSRPCPEPFGRGQISGPEDETEPQTEDLTCPLNRTFGADQTSDLAAKPDFRSRSNVRSCGRL